MGFVLAFKGLTFNSVAVGALLAVVWQVNLPDHDQQPTATLQR
jgi:hypothetical protein